MKIKSIIGMIAIAISSISVAQAGHDHHNRGYDQHYERSNHYRSHHRPYWKKARHERRHYREQRHYRKHHNRYERSHRYNKRAKHERRYRTTTYTPAHITTTSRVIVSSRRHHSNNALPIVAGGLIGSVIANDASHGDPVATFGGAVIGALVGNAISHH